VYKGSEAWLATFNRVYLLQEVYKEGRYDYVMYLDPGKPLSRTNSRALFEGVLILQV
jgi:hypothetical protein